jgi:hypothetical protein
MEYPGWIPFSAAERRIQRMATKKKPETKSNGGDLGFDAQPWKAADALQSNLDAAEYKHAIILRKVRSI